MSTSPEDIRARAVDVTLTEEEFVVHLADGRKLGIPLTWYPRLLHGTPEERAHWTLIGKGIGIHWPALDEDIRVGGLLDGQPSGESERSFRNWLSSREK